MPFFDKAFRPSLKTDGVLMPSVGHYCRQRSFGSISEGPLIQTLQNMCFQQIVQSLCEQKLFINGLESNPFRAVPSSFVNELFTRVADSHDSSMATLDPLVQSGKLTKLRLTYSSRISTADFLLVCRTLEPFAHDLIEISIDAFYPRGGVGQRDCARAIEKLLMAACHLKILRVPVPFNLRTIRHLEQLQTLEVNVSVIKATLKIKRAVFHKKNNLTHIYVDRCSQQSLKKKEVAVILQSCPHLLSLKNDVAMALEYLHDTFSTLPRYKLQSVVLGKALSCGVSSVHVELAAVVFPEIANLELYTCDEQALLHVLEMHDLQMLTLKWMGNSVSPSDFDQIFVPFLRSMQQRLRSLFVSGFNNISFDSFLTYAPNLVELKVIGMWGTDRDMPTRYVNPDPSDVKLYFSHLQYLNLSFPILSREDAVALYMSIFTRAPKLQRLQIFTRTTFDFDDELLSLSLIQPQLHLSHVTLHKCSLTASSIVTFVNHCPSLEVLYFSASLDLSATDVQYIRQNLQPMYDIRNFNVFNKCKIFRIT